MCTAAGNAKPDVEAPPPVTQPQQPEPEPPAPPIAPPGSRADGQAKSAEPSSTSLRFLHSHWPEDWPDAPNVSCAAPPATNGVDVSNGPKLRTDIAEMTTDKHDPVDEARAQRRMLACLDTPHR